MHYIMSVNYIFKEIQIHKIVKDCLVEMLTTKRGIKTKFEKKENIDFKLFQNKRKLDFKQSQN